MKSTNAFFIFALPFVLLTIDPSWAHGETPLSIQDLKLRPDDGDEIDGFGISVSISADSNTLLVGAERADIEDLAQPGVFLADQGAAYLFERAPGGDFDPANFIKLVASDGAAGDNFGIAVSLSPDGNTAAVGSKSPITGTAYDLDAGAVYIFGRDEGGPDNWGLIKKIIGPEEPSDHPTNPILPSNLEFGQHLELSSDGSLLIVGDPFASFPPSGINSNRGAAYLFERDFPETDDWGLRKRFEDVAGRGVDNFGWGVALDTDTALVGAFGAGPPGSETGKAYLYERSTGGPDTWGLSKTLTASDGTVGAGFGHGVALSSDGDTAAITGQGDTDPQIYIFERDNGGPGIWGETRIFPAPGAFDDLTFSETDDDVLIAAGVDIGTVAGAQIFGRDAGGNDNWGAIKVLVAENGEAGGLFAEGIAMAGDTPVIGASRTDVGGNEDQGVAFVFGPPRYRPDHLIGKRRGRQKGNNLYSPSGAGQAERVIGKGRRPVKYFTTVQNDGNITDIISLRGSLRNRKFRTTFRQISPVGRNVTALVSRGRLLLSVDPRTPAIFRITHKPRTTRARRTFRFTAQSRNDLSLTDLVKAKAKSKPRRR